MTQHYCSGSRSFLLKMCQSFTIKPVRSTKKYSSSHWQESKLSLWYFIGNECGSFWPTSENMGWKTNLLTNKGNWITAREMSGQKPVQCYESNITGSFLTHPCCRSCSPCRQQHVTADFHLLRSSLFWFNISLLMFEVWMFVSTVSAASKAETSDLTETETWQKIRNLIRSNGNRRKELRRGGWPKVEVR